MTSDEALVDDGPAGDGPVLAGEGPAGPGAGAGTPTLLPA